MKSLTLIIIAAFATIVFADGQFKSRPDLSPPVLNFSSHYNPDSSELAKGYIFITPYSPDSNDVEKRVLQPAGYIFTDSGDLIWSGFSYFGGHPFNFQASKIDDEPVLFAFEGVFATHGGHGHGHIKILDNEYKLIKEIRAGNHELVDLHEFQITDNAKHGLIETYSNTNHYDLSEFNEGNPLRNWITNAIFQEIDLETNEVIFQWKSLDHVSPSNSFFKLSDLDSSVGYQSATAWNYFHINSVDKNSEGDYLISSRFTSTIYKISHKTGEIIWKFSTFKGSDFEIIGENFTFGFQHHARFIESNIDSDIEIISFFDNSAFSDDLSIIINPTNSSGKIIKLNTKEKTAKLIKQYNPPNEYSISVLSQGSFQFLPNGNKLINWGSEGAVTEYDSEGNVLYHVNLDSGKRADVVQSYRAFKFEWDGHSNEDIAVYYETDKDFTTIYLSWNGDTQTEKWHVVNSQTNKSVVKFNKDSFETRHTFETALAPSFFIRAVNLEGDVLKESSPYEVISKASILNQLNKAFYALNDLYNFGDHKKFKEDYP